MTKKSSVTIQSLQLGWEIVDLVAQQDRPLKFNEICEMSRISKSNLYKYLNTLTQLGILYREKSSGLYSLGSKLIEYGMLAVNQEDAVERVTPFLQEIHRTCKETVMFASWSHAGPIVVKMFNSQQGLNIGAQIGTILPLFTAAGKVFAAFHRDPSAVVWKEQQLSEMDDETKAKFEEVLSEVRKAKIAFAKEPLVPSISSIALPIFKYDESLVGAVIVVGFTDTLPSDTDDEMGRYLLKEAREMSAAFGYRGE